MTEEYPYAEPFGALYERLDPDTCPDCSCCTARLCQAGKLSMLGCLGRTAATDTQARAAIADCPCDQTPDSARTVLAANLEGVTDPEERRRIIVILSANYSWAEQLQRGTRG